MNNFFKEEVVKFAVEHGNKEAASFFGINEVTIGVWRRTMGVTSKNVKELIEAGGYVVTSIEHQEVIREKDEILQRNRKLSDEWELKEQINMCLQDICQNLLDAKNISKEIFELQEERQAKHQARIDKLKSRLERNELKLKYFEERFDILTKMEYNEAQIEIDNEDYLNLKGKKKGRPTKLYSILSEFETMTISESPLTSSTDSGIDTQIDQLANVETTVTEEGDNEFECDNDDVIRVMSRNIDDGKVRVLNLDLSLLDILDRCDERRDPLIERCLPNNLTELSVVQRQTEPSLTETSSEKTVPVINDTSKLANDTISKLTNDLSEAAKENQSFEIQVNETTFENGIEDGNNEKCEDNFGPKALLGDILSLFY